MQLISITLLLTSVLLLLCAIRFLWLWHRAWRYESLLSCNNDNIGHYGITMVTAYPTTLQPLLAMIEERYPRSEAILLCDMQRDIERFGDAIRHFHLVRVNHDHLEGVRALYRSRQRAYRRVVVIDLPCEEHLRSKEIAREVASYGYILYTEGDTIIEPDTATRCIDIIASYPIDTPLSLMSLVGEAVEVRMTDAHRAEQHTVAHPLVWSQKRHFGALLSAALTASLIVVAGGAFCHYTLMLYLATIAIMLYISCRITSKKNLFVRLDTILLNFCRFIVDFIKRFCYLYKRESSIQHKRAVMLWRHPKSSFLRNNRRGL